MTKKLLISFSEIGVRKTKRNEFIIPNLDYIDKYFVGIESGKSYEYGYVVYTGVDLNPDIIIEKLLKNKIISQTSSEIENTILKYLEFIKNCKISDVIGINTESGKYKYFVTGLKPRTEISKIPN